MCVRVGNNCLYLGFCTSLKVKWSRQHCREEINEWHHILQICGIFWHLTFNYHLKKNLPSIYLSELDLILICCKESSMLRYWYNKLLNVLEIDSCWPKWALRLEVFFFPENTCWDRSLTATQKEYMVCLVCFYLAICRCYEKLHFLKMKIT